MDDIPPTEAELAAANDPLFAESMPRQPRKHRHHLDTRQASTNELITAAIEEHKAYLDQLLIGVIAELRHMFNQKLEHVEEKLKAIEQQVEIERRVNERTAVQVSEQRNYTRANGHA